MPAGCQGSGDEADLQVLLRQSFTLARPTPVSPAARGSLGHLEDGLDAVSHLLDMADHRHQAAPAGPALEGAECLVERVGIEGSEDLAPEDAVDLTAGPARHLNQSQRQRETGQKGLAAG